MRLLVTFDLTRADLGLFTRFEDTVLALLPDYGARLEMRLRAVDGRCEIHCLYFPNAAALERYRADPVRLGALADFERSGATSTSLDVERLADDGPALSPLVALRREGEETL